MILVINVGIYLTSSYNVFRLDNLEFSASDLQVSLSEICTGRVASGPPAHRPGREKRSRSRAGPDV